MRKISNTHRLADGRSIECEAEEHRGRLRLRARLVDANGVVEASHKAACPSC